MNKEYIAILQEWKDLRERVVYCEKPYETVKQFFQNKPTVSIQTDPYDQDRWPEPWELIGENIYCEFTKILAIYYTFQLTPRFSTSDFKIYIIRDKKNHMEFPVLFINDDAICYANENICKQDLTNDYFVILKEYHLSQHKLQKEKERI